MVGAKCADFANLIPCARVIHMKRILILALVLIAAGIGFEQYSGKSIGVAKSIEFGTNVFTGAFAGGYGMATDVGRSVGGGTTSLGKSVGNSMGSVFGN